VLLTLSTFIQLTQLMATNRIVARHSPVVQALTVSCGAVESIESVKFDYRPRTATLQHAPRGSG